MKIRTGATITVLFLMFALQSFGQGFNPYAVYGEPAKKNTFRTILNKFTFTVSGGYGHTFNSHTFSNYSFLERNGTWFLSPEAPSGMVLEKAYTNWLNAPRLEENINFNEDDFLLQDTSLNFSGNSGSIPFSLMIHYEIDRFKLGVGASAELFDLPRLQLKEAGNLIEAAVPDPPTSVFTRFYGVVGFRYFQWVDYQYWVDLQAGVQNYGTAYDLAALQKGIYFDLGFPIEKALSEYFRIFLRPAVEMRNYSINLPDAASIQHKQPVASVQFGVRINYPEIPRCPIKACKTQMKHIHSGREFRGQPIYKKQNPKIGELHPKLKKYKGGNKRRLDSGY